VVKKKEKQEDSPQITQIHTDLVELTL